MHLRLLCAGVLLLLVPLGSVAQAEQPSPTRLGTSTRSSASSSLSPTLSRPANSTLSTLAASTATASTNATSTASPSSTTSATPTSESRAPESASAAPTLDTHIEPWSGVLGGVLIVSSICLGATAAQLPRTGAAIAGLYAGALVVGLLILEFAVAAKLEPPSATARGLYVLASVGSGLVVAVPCALFHASVAPLTGSLAGFAIGVFLLSTRSDALIRPVGLRYILVVGLIAVGFVLSSIKRIQPHVLLACTCAIAAFVVVLGIDCFTCAGLKELYVYVLGLDKLFPKLEGHYRLTTAIIAELAATVAAVFIFMAVQSRFLSIFVRRDAEAKRAQRDEAKREEELARTNRRRSRIELSDWEEKSGAGATSSGSSDELAWANAAALEMEKARSTGSMASLLSAGVTSFPTQSHSVDFLPKLNGAHPPGSPALTDSQDPHARAPNRPVLASIQPAAAPSQHNGKPEWDSYVATRKVAVAEPKPVGPKRASRTLSLFSIGRRRTEPAPSVKVHAVEEETKDDKDADEDDDVPLAAVRSLSASSIPRPSTMYDLSSASAPNLGGPSHSSTSLLAAPPPRSRSRLSLAMPAVLAAPPASPPLALTARQPATLARVGRSSTLLDLNAPSTFDPYHDRARQAKDEASKGPERIAVGERRRAQSGPQLDKDKGKKRESVGGARIMDFGELEEKHRKRLSMLQGTANDKVTSSAALARFQAEQRAEAEQQRKREARRSVDSNLHLLGGRGAGGRSTGASASAEQTRRRASASVGSLSGLLRRGTARADEREGEEQGEEGEGEDHVPLEALRRGAAPSSTSLAPTARSRRASTQALVHAPAPQAQRPALASSPARPSAQRRHSLGTLLEVASSSRDDAPLAPPADRVDKVVAWRRAGAGTGTGAGPAAVARGVGEAALLQRVADKAAPPQPQQQPRPQLVAPQKKKHDWLSY